MIWIIHLAVITEIWNKILWQIINRRKIRLSEESRSQSKGLHLGTYRFKLKYEDLYLTFTSFDNQY
ncbi:hypothetical protein BXY58_2429 [Epilithonimonas arachidiradicis]|uniref:Uncharacterized protein n=1 Tax=Epilithonimonas arachidiradicis TaxID=1617282 RepID=A0A420D7G8_9FLAO|nr:hypothetical protein BXY58_2429 [Epilithonimonas arachidiradicis]